MMEDNLGYDEDWEDGRKYKTIYRKKNIENDNSQDNKLEEFSLPSISNQSQQDKKISESS